MKYKIQRLKPYKAKHPHQTISDIRNILFDCKIFTTELHTKAIDTDVYSCRIKIDDDRIDRLDIGTNGKGMTRQYSLASGYAEFMERIQSGSIFSFSFYKGNSLEILNNICKKNNLSFSFYEAPDEKNVNIEELYIQNSIIYNNIFKTTNKNIFFNKIKKLYNKNELLCVPFYNYKNKSEDYLPIMLLKDITGSNGMCAGNTKEEALIQGICEIFERYVLKKIFFEGIIPPNIPHDYFNGTEILNKIKHLEQNNNYTLLIKDCSLNMNLPVVGLLLIDKLNQKYSFNLGADPSPITALERCLSEMYQGNIYKEKINISDNIYNDNKNLTINTKIINYYNINKNGNGIWPNSIFSNKSSYTFKGFEYKSTLSDKKDMNYIISKILNLKFNIYIRDVSFLGFPSFYIYIPGMSETDNIFNDKSLSCKENMRNITQTIFKLKNIISNKEVKKIADYIEKYNKYVLMGDYDIRQIFNYNLNESIQSLHPDIFLCMLFYRLKKYNKAFYYINRFIKMNLDIDIADIEEKNIYLYYYCIRDYIKFKINNLKSTNITNNLTQLFGKDIVSEVMNDISKPENIFRNIPLPSCFNCDKCEIKTDCRYYDVLKYIKIIQNKYKNNVINQLNIMELFK